MTHRFQFKPTKAIAWSLVTVYITFMAGCSYYRAKILDPLSNESIVKQLKKEQKYFILHIGEEVYHFKDITINNDNSEVKGVLETLPINHSYYKTAKPSPKANRYKIKDPENDIDKPVHEIHIYATTVSGELNSIINIPFSSINKIELYVKHTGATIGVAVGTTVIALSVLAIIVAATKSSCPFVYICNEETYYFTGEMYGGAIYPSLERDDYMPLPNFKPINGTYKLKISNELLEKQYTNLANLIVTSHPENMNVLLDKNGNIQSLVNPLSPLVSLTDRGIDYTKQVELRDNVPYLFDEPNDENSAMSSLIMSFKRPANAQMGKLVINTKNSYWLDFAYGKFNELFGIYYNTFAEQQRKEPASKLNQWSLDQNIPLSVYIQTKSGWKFVDYFNPIGPLASRDIVVPVDLTDVISDEIKIKLESGFMFWELDYAAMDFSPNIPMEVTSIAPASANDENGKDVSELISITDEKYLLQPEIGNVVTVSYNEIPTPAGYKQTVFLHSRGYYEYIRGYENLPSTTSYLETFKEKAAFTRFAKERYDAFINNQDIFAKALITYHED